MVADRQQPFAQLQRIHTLSATYQFVPQAAKGRSSQICDGDKLGEGAGIRANC